MCCVVCCVLCVLCVLCVCLITILAQGTSTYAVLLTVDNSRCGASGLSAGAIAGIVVGAVVLLAVLLLLGLLLYRRLTPNSTLFRRQRARRRGFPAEEAIYG